MALNMRTANDWGTSKQLLDALAAGIPAKAPSVLRKEIAGAAEPEADSRRVRFVISTGDVDRDNDIVSQTGWALAHYLKNPVVLWAHSHTDLPIGRCVSVAIENGKLVAVAEFADHPFAETVYRMIQRGFLSATSVGFRATKYAINEQRQGIDFLEQELLEFSVVPVPANQHALIAAEASGLDLGPLRKWLEDTIDAWPGEITLKGKTWDKLGLPASVVTRKRVGELELETRVPASVDALPAAIAKALAPAMAAMTERIEGIAKSGFMGKPTMFLAAGDGPEPVVFGAPVERWNRSLSKAFDVDQADFPPQSVEQDLASKYIGAKLSSLDHGIRRVRSTRMPAFLAALDELLAKDDINIESLRNIDYNGREAPPQYEKIRYNSKEEHEHLIDGMRFLRWNNERMCLRVEPAYYGLCVSYYAIRRQEGSGAAAFMDAVQARAKQLNFLRGEAFALSGEFLERKGEGAGDLILNEKNAGIVNRVIALVDEKGADMEPRGMLMLGPPGTGKTLTGRILMNGTKSTFVWVSSRDMAYYGSSGAIEEAFDVARECAPSILFFEDVDNWIDRATVTDLLKTELDGIKQNKGVLTILTTNYPERLPKALIDRPGRFHDVLRFDLPDEKQRKAMIERWMPTLDEAAVAVAVEATAGMSGAHVRELARFANIIAEQDKVASGDALTQALAKLQEQRDLITSVQSGGSAYRAAAFLVGKGATLATKRGRALSTKNESKLAEAYGAAGVCRDAIDEVLAAVRTAPPEPDSDPEDAPATEDPECSDADKVLDLADDGDDDNIALDLIEEAAYLTLADEESPREKDGGEDLFDADDLRSALRDVFAEVPVAELVRTATERAMNQMRGRLD